MDCSRKNLAAYAGSMSQLFGVRNLVLQDGRARGTRAVQLYNMAGLELLLLPDRGMDIAVLRCDGVNIGAESKSGIVHPSYFQKGTAEGFLDTFQQGFLTTCGLTYMGATCQEDGKTLGMHGEFSNTPAEVFSHQIIWRDDQAVAIEVRGIVAQKTVFGSHFQLERCLRLSIAENKFTICDTVQNCGFQKEPFMLLYHLNYGFPFLTPSLQVVVPRGAITPNSAVAAQQLVDCDVICPPCATFEKHAFSRDVASDTAGRTGYLVYDTMRPLGVSVSYQKEKLPVLTHWRCFKSGDYVLGLEPGNCHVRGRDVARQDGTLRYLEPFEVEESTLSVEILTTHSEIQDREMALRSL